MSSPSNHQRLAGRLIFRIVLASSAITLLITALQLYLDFRRDVGEIDSRMALVEESYLGSIVQNVWLADRARLQPLLDGIRRLPDFRFAGVEVEGKPYVTSGNPPTSSDLVRRFPLTHLHRGARLDIGTLTVAASLDGVVQRIIERVGFILVANGVKTALVAVLIYLLVQRMVARHLSAVAHHARRIGSGDFDTPLELGAGPEDELRDLGHAFEDMREGLRSLNERMRSLNAELARTLAERTEALERSQRSETALAESRAHLAQAQAIGNLGSWEWSFRDDRITFTEEFARVYGIRDSASTLSYQAFLDAVVPEDRSQAAARIRQAIGSTGAFSMEHRIHRPDGNVRFVHHQGAVIRNAAGDPIRMLGTVRDVTDRKRAEEDLELAASVFANTSEGIMITDPRGVIVSVNRAFTDITGYSPEDAVGRTPRILKSDFHDDAFYAELWTQLKETGRWHGEVWNRRKNGEVYLQWETIAAIDDADGHRRNYVAIFADVTEIRRKDERLRYQAYHDALTGLPNRTLLHDRLEQALNFARRSDGRVALLLLDLDRFKLVNDSLGHELGDLLLKAVAERIGHCLRRSDTVARLGGDEFVCLLTDVRDTTDVAHVAEKILDALADPMLLRGHEVHIGASIGISNFPEDGEDVPTLLKNADAAMYQAKESGRSTFRFFDASSNTRAVERLDLEARLRRAVQNEEFELHYQPQVAVTGRGCRGVEALIRWRHPVKGMISPADFIPLAEETGLIMPIGEWALVEACRQTRQWQERGVPVAHVSVNLSARQFQDKGLVQRIASILDRTGLRPECLEIELTETTVMANPDQAIRTLGELNEAGISISVDDFGTGYSSLSYLKRLPLDTLKIDRFFLQDIGHDPRDRAIVESIIGLGRSLELAIVAEGVETVEQLEFLRQRNCHWAQGYLFARPLASAPLEHWFREFEAARSLEPTA